jgi:hypothetical protein
MGEIKGISLAERANTKFQDAPAVQFVSVANLLRAMETNCDVFLQLAGPWAMMGQVFYNPWLTRATRLVLLEVADAAFSFVMHSDVIDNIHLCESNVYTGDGGVLYVWSGEHMRRGVTLCAALWWVINKYTSIRLALGRVNTHGCEEHFGNIGESLPADDSWLKWVRAEACAVIDSELRAKRNIPNRVRPKRLPVGGVTLVEEGFEGCQNGSPEGSRRDPMRAVSMCSG